LKTALKFCLLLLAAAAFSGCWSWQKTVSMGLWQSDEERLQERAVNEQEALMRKCEDADEISCNNLAVNFSALKNFNDAKIYYKKACDKGLATACSNLGQIYEQGLADEKIDLKQAMNLYKIACDANDGVGCYNEALLIYSQSRHKAQNKEKDARETLALLAKSCELDYAQACFLLAKFVGDEKRAQKLYDRACKLGKCAR